MGLSFTDEQFATVKDKDMNKGWTCDFDTFQAKYDTLKSTFPVKHGDDVVKAAFEAMDSEKNGSIKVNKNGWVDGWLVGISQRFPKQMFFKEKDGVVLLDQCG